MNGLVMPHKSPEPRAAWWVAPLSFLIVGAFDGAAVFLWFVRN